MAVKNGLSKTQLRAIEIMANPDEDYTQEEVAIRVGVRRQTISEWKQNPDFVDKLVERTEHYFDVLRAKAVRKLNDKLDAGHFGAIRLVLTRHLQYESTKNNNTESESVDSVLSDVENIVRRAQKESGGLADGENG